MASYLRYTYVGFAVTAGLIATFVVAAVNPELRPGAVLAFFVLLIARIAIGVPRSIAWRRYAAELKAANGGALPIPYPVRARRILAILFSVLGGLGLIALIAGAVIGGTEQLILSILGLSLLLATAILMIEAWRLFRRRAAADLAAAEASAATSD
jgi:hypothetical protein